MKSFYKINSKYNKLNNSYYCVLFVFRLNLESWFAPVAQLDRASDYGSEGLGV